MMVTVLGFTLTDLINCNAGTRAPPIAICQKRRALVPILRCQFKKQRCGKGTLCSPHRTEEQFLIY